MAIFHFLKKSKKKKNKFKVKKKKLLILTWIEERKTEALKLVCNMAKPFYYIFLLFNFNFFFICTVEIEHSFVQV